jgi:hypothetical protein
VRDEEWGEGVRGLVCGCAEIWSLGCGCVAVWSKLSVSGGATASPAPA